MTKDEKNLLIRQAMKLTTLGIKVERERDKLKRLVEQGIPYTDQRLLSALNQFEKAHAEWKQLEAEHLALKKKLEKQNT